MSGEQCKEVDNIKFIHKRNDMKMMDGERIYSTLAVWIRYVFSPQLRHVQLEVGGTALFEGDQLGFNCAKHI